MADIKIAWTDRTWNPVVGCSKVSPGCDNCYAEVMAKRLKGMCLAHNHSPQYLGVVDEKGWTGRTECCDWLLDKPLHWRKPRRIFVNSMGDLFHPSVPFDFIDRIWWTMSVCREHIFQILTKRPERYLEYWQHRLSKGFTDGNRANIWAGVTAENQEMADKRIPILLQIPAAVRFVSIEPMLRPVDIQSYLDPLRCPKCGNIETPDGYDVLGADEGNLFCNSCGSEEAVEALTPLSWVIVGAESGPNRRYCSPQWVRSVVEQCKDAGVPCFVKQTHLMGCRKCGFAPCTHLAGHKPKVFLIKNRHGWPREYPEVTN